MLAVCMWYGTEKHPLCFQNPTSKEADKINIMVLPLLHQSLIGAKGKQVVHIGDDEVAFRSWALREDRGYYFTIIKFPNIKKIQIILRFCLSPHFSALIYACS